METNTIILIILFITLQVTFYFINKQLNKLNKELSYMKVELNQLTKVSNQAKTPEYSLTELKDYLEGELISSSVEVKLPETSNQVAEPSSEAAEPSPEVAAGNQNNEHSTPKPPLNPRKPKSHRNRLR